MPVKQMEEYIPHSRCQGPEAGESPACFRTDREAGRDGMLRALGRVGRDQSQSGQGWWSKLGVWVLVDLQRGVIRKS